MTKFIVVYDACILYSFTLRNLFIDLAMTDLFQAKWTEKIHKEWIENILCKQPAYERSKLDTLKKLINKSVPDCLVTKYETLIPSLRLPDQNDCHILAAAIHCGAQAIITQNLKDFPDELLSQYDVEAVSPDTFFKLQLDLSNEKVLGAVKKSRKRLKNPSFSADDYLTCLSKKGLTESAFILRHYVDLI